MKQPSILKIAALFIAITSICTPVGISAETVPTPKKEEPASVNPIVISDDSVISTYGDVIAKGETKKIDVTETMKTVAVSHGGIIEATISSDHKTLQIQGKQKGVTLLIINTENKRILQLLITVSNDKTEKINLQKRFLDMQKSLFEAKK
jgi:Flp pilus assembly secretin CpaC